MQDFSINQLPISLIYIDNSFRITQLNPEAAHIFNLKVGDNLSHIHFVTLENEVFKLHSCINNNTSFIRKSLVYKKTSGDDLVLFTHLKKIKHGNKYNFIIVFTDISSEIDCNIPSEDTYKIINYSNIIGHDKRIIDLKRQIELASDTNITVLISGESGTGKELVADAIHYQSERKNKPFIKVNCAALSETLLESELFGHVKGSFTGAYKDKTGRFEQAHGGTIFLDEIGEISLALQVKLLRVLQQKTIEKVGDNKPINVDMRIIAATNKDLRILIGEQKFREDLFYRLNVFPIQTPALRERINDIPLLCTHFIRHNNIKFTKNIKSLSSSAYKFVMDYCWPGNVRELENALEYAFVVCSNSVIDIEDFPQELRSLAYQEGYCKKKMGLPNIIDNKISVQKTVGGRLLINKETLIHILEQHAWSQTKTAAYLSISRTALWKKMKRFEINSKNA